MWPGAPGAWPACVPRGEGEPGARRLVVLHALTQPWPAGVLRASPEVPETELAQSGPTARTQAVQPEGDPCGWSPQTPAPAKLPSEETGKQGLPCTARQGPSPLRRTRPSHGFPEGWRPCCPPGCWTSLEATPSSCAAGDPAPQLQGRSSQRWVTGWGPVLPSPGPRGAATALRV